MYDFKHYYVIKARYYYNKYIVRYRCKKNDRNPQFICLCNDKDTAQIIADILNKVE